MELTLEEITYLGNMMDQKNDLGIFSNIVVPLKGDEKESLVKKGVIFDNNFVPGMDIFLGILSSPQRCCRFVAQVGYLTIEKYSYYKENKLVLAQNNRSKFIFSVDSDLKNVKWQLIDLYGASNLKTTSFSSIMNLDETMIFAALVDLYRKEELLSYICADKSKNSFSLEHLETYITEPMKNGLVNFFLKNFKNFSIPSDLKVPLSELIKKSIVENNNALRFNEQIQFLAKNLLLFHSVSLLEILNLKDGKIVVSTTVFLNAGVHDVLRIQLLDKGTDLSTVTSKEQIDEIIWALECPQLEVQ